MIALGLGLFGAFLILIEQNANLRREYNKENDVK